MVTCYVSLRTWIHSAHLHRSPAHEEGTLLSPSLDSERLRLRKVQRLVQSFPVPWPLAVIGRYAKMWGIGWMGEGEGVMGGEPPGGRHTLQPLTPIIRSPGAPWEMPPSDLGQRNNMKATLFLPQDLSSAETRLPVDKASKPRSWALLGHWVCGRRFSIHFPKFS